MQSEALLFLVGGIIPQIGFWSPFAMRLYGRLSPADRLNDRVAYVEKHPFWWHEHNVGFGAGALTVAVAFAFLAVDVLTVIAALAAAAGAALGTAFAIRRTLSDPREWFTGAGGTILFCGFSLLTILAFVIVGVHFLEGEFGLGVFLLVWNALLFGVLVWLRDLPPFTHYVGAIVVGVVLLV